MLILYACMTAATLALQAAFRGSLTQLFVTRPHLVRGVPTDVALGVGFGLLTVVLTRIASARFEWARRLDAEFHELLRPLGPSDVPALAFMSSLAEELFFRGFLQPLLGLVATSVVFGLAHLPHQRYWIPWTIAAMVMGLAFGWMFEARGALLAPVLAHFTINFFNLHALIRPRGTEPA
jgi:membrane protease YdiL (CAAX protease family)